MKRRRDQQKPDDGRFQYRGFGWNICAYIYSQACEFKKGSNSKADDKVVF